MITLMSRLSQPSHVLQLIQYMCEAKCEWGALSSYLYTMVMRVTVDEFGHATLEVSDWFPHDQTDPFSVPEVGRQ